MEVIIEPGRQRNILTVYHQTSPQICDLIMRSYFRKGDGGWCGDALYFAFSPWVANTKAITKGSHDGCMIEAKVDAGKVFRFRKKRTCAGFNAQKLRMSKHDSIIIDPGDGPE